MINLSSIVKVKAWIFPAGLYYIGDPCYVVSDEDWMPLLERTGYFGSHPSSEYNNGLFEYKGAPAFCHETFWGDGTYHITPTGTMIGVDAGLISLIPARVSLGNSDEPFGTGVAQFDKDFEVWYDNGVFHFDGLIIDTK